MLDIYATYILHAEIFLHVLDTFQASLKHCGFTYIKIGFKYLNLFSKVHLRSVDNRHVRDMILTWMEQVLEYKTMGHVSICSNPKDFVFCQEGLDILRNETKV
jgi:hypothetical protein